MASYYLKCKRNTDSKNRHKYTADPDPHLNLKKSGPWAFRKGGPYAKI